MGYPYADPRRFDGLLAHAERYLGPVTHGQSAELDGHNRGFSIGFHQHTEFPMLSAVTSGVRFQQVTALLPEEFVVSALPDQEFEASYLVHVVAERAISNGQGYEYGGGYVNAEPLIPGTSIEFLLAWPHAFVDEEFDVYRDDDGTAALQYITLIPATRAEFELVHEHNDDPQQLVELWESRDTNLLDLYRTSAI